LLTLPNDDRHAEAATEVNGPAGLPDVQPELRPVIASGHPLHPMDMVVNGLYTVAVFFPVMFVLEEVAFRGALDAHVHQPGESRGWLSALFVATLFGLWHLPLEGTGGALAGTIALTFAAHWLIGIPLSFAWRRSGNLTAPTLAHTMIDAARNMLLAGM
jgi:membrane protease YdiL (CAAX protease family)